MPEYKNEFCILYIGIICNILIIIEITLLGSNKL